MATSAPPPPIIQSAQGGNVTLGGAQLIMLGSNNYLGLADHPKLKADVTAAVERYGIGTCINPCFVKTPIHDALEAELADFLGVEQVLLYTSCSAANAGVLAGLAGAGDQIFSDDMNHASIIDGCRLSRADALVYAYRSPESLAQKLASAPTAQKRFVIIDGVFSMEGDLAPLEALARVADDAGATLIVDDSHATGVLGPKGKGSIAELGLDPARFVMTGTFSNALGGPPGGFVAASGAVIEELRAKSRSFIFTTGMSVPDAAASLAALRLLRDTDEPFETLWRNTHWFRKRLREAAVQFEDARSPITALPVGDKARAMAIHKTLRDRGVYIPVMAHPIVARGDARLRAQPSAALSEAEVERACEAISGAFADHRA
jgi:glycine C-acetyltransferase